MKPPTTLNEVTPHTPDRRNVCRWLGASTLAVAGLLASPLASAQKSTLDTGRYSRIPRSADGIGKVYMGREIAGVMGWQGAAWLERDERQQEERGDLLLRELGLKPEIGRAHV